MDVKKLRDNGLAVLTLLTTNWPALVAIAGGIYAALMGFAEKPLTHVIAGVILVVLWTWIGLLYLWDRRRPRAVTVAHDYRYALTIDAVQISYSPLLEKALGFGISMRNYSSGPIRYEVTRFDVQIESRVLPKLKKGVLVGYMARGGGKTAWGDGFKMPDVKEFFERRAEGVIELEVIYGHPEEDPVRKLNLTAVIVVVLHENAVPGFNHKITEETDLPIDEMPKAARSWSPQQAPADQGT